MKKSKKSMPSILGVGVASIIFIFMLLSLITFSVLAYSSASSDYRLSAKAAERTSTYNEASNQAQEHMSDIDAILKEAYKQKPTYMDVVEQEIAALSWTANTELESTKDEEGILVSWKEKIDEGQHISVMLKIVPPEPGKSFYKVEQYRVEASREWRGDTSLKVFGSEKSK